MRLDNVAVRLAACVGASLLMATSAGSQPTQAVPPADPALAAPDPSLVRGSLPNGLRYLILPNHTPRGAVSLRFYVRAGADDETEAQRGAAHFVEHMAFEGSGRFPGDAVDKAFAQAGVSAVRDQNAFTDAFGTDYVFDLQAATPDKLDLALAFLRAAADDLSFDPAAVDRERQVVLAELSARKSGGTELSELVARFFAPTLLPPRRTPGGTPASLARIDAPMLRAFHDRWYRPERTTVIVVGDVDPQAARGAVARAFSTWMGKGAAPPDPGVGAIDPHRPAAALAVTTPNFAQGALQICHVAPRDPKLAPGEDSIRREALDALWSGALQERLSRAARAPDAPFDSAGASRNDAYHLASFTCLNATPKPDRWKDAATLLATETRRLALHGVQEAEAERGRQALAARLEESRAAAATRPTEALARLLLAAEIEGEPLTTPAELSRVFARVAPSITAQAATDAFRARLASGPRVAVLASTTPATTAELTATLDAAETAPPPAPPAPEAVVRWPYTRFGTPGRVVSRRAIVDPAFTRLTFGNGVVLNFKRTAFQKGVVTLRVSFGAGQTEIARDRLTAALAGVATFSEGGFGRLDAESVQRALHGRIWSLTLGFDRTRFTLAGSTRPPDLELELQIAAAALTDPGFRPEQALRVRTVAKSLYKENAIQPVRAAQQALGRALPPPHPYDLPAESEFAAVGAADMAQALKPSLAHDALEVTLVGDVDEAAAVEAVAATLGALPRRRDASQPPPGAVFSRYGAPPATPILAPHLGLKEKAAVLVTWPLYVWTPERLRETRALTLLRELMGAELRREVRERLGLTYTPAIDLSLQRGGDQGALAVAVETSPANMEATRAAILALGARLAQPAGVDPARLEEIRKPLLEDATHRQESNAWWTATLDGSAAQPFQLEMARTWQHDYAGISAAEVQAAATRWLSRPPYVAISLPKVEPAAPASPPGITAPAAPVPPPVAPPPGGLAPGGPTSVPAGQGGGALG